MRAHPIMNRTSMGSAGVFAVLIWVTMPPRQSRLILKAESQNQGRLRVLARTEQLLRLLARVVRLGRDERRLRCRLGQRQREVDDELRLPPDLALQLDPALELGRHQIVDDVQA